LLPLGKLSSPFQGQAEKVAKEALRQMLLKLCESEVNDINSLSQEEFNKILGARLIIFAGGYAQRYSPTGLINKTVARATQEESNLRLAYNGAFKTPGLAPVIVIDDIVLQAVLKDEYLDSVKFAEIKENLLQDGKTGELNGFIIDENIQKQLFDSEKAKKVFPEGAIIIYGHFNGHGGAFMDAIDLLASVDKADESKYYVTLFGELASTQDLTKANTGLITYLQEVAGDYLITAGGKRSTDIIGKGNFIFDDEGRLVALTDWKYIKNVHGEDIIETLGNVQKALQKTPKERTPDEEQLLSQWETVIGNEALINATINVFRNDIREYFDTFRQEAETGRYSQNRDPDTGELTLLVWDLIDIVARHYQGDGWPIGFIDVGRGPDSIKNAERHNRFSYPVWKKGLAEYVKSLEGVEADELQELTVTLDPEAKIDVQKRLKKLLEGKNITLKGKVHIDLSAEIDKDVVIENSYILGGSKIGEGSHISNAILEEVDVGKNVTISGISEIGGLSPSLIVTSRGKDNKVAIGDNATIGGNGYLRQDVQAGVKIELIDQVLGGYPDYRILTATDSSPPEYREQGNEELRGVREAISLYALPDESGESLVDLNVFKDKPLREYSVKGLPIYDPTLKLYILGDGPADSGVISKIFGRNLDNPRKPKEGIKKRVDQIFLVGEVKLSPDARIGNGTYIENSELRFGTYLGNGWGVKQVKAQRVIFSDNVLIVNRGREGHLSYYVPPEAGRMNSASFAIASTFRNAYIGAGSGREHVYLEDGRKGYFKQTIENTVIPEGATVNGNVNSIRRNEQDLAEAIRDADDPVQLILAGIEEGFQQDTTVTSREGRITMVATALALIKTENEDMVNGILDAIKGGKNNALGLRIEERIKTVEPFVLSWLAEEKVLPVVSDGAPILDLNELSEETGLGKSALREAIAYLVMEKRIGEYLPVIEKFTQNGEPIFGDKLELKSEVHKTGDWHATVHVLVVDKWGNVLLQEKKDGGIDIAASGHLRVGESLNVENAVFRELNEEVLGLGIPLLEQEKRLHRIGIFRKQGSPDVGEEGFREGVYEYKTSKKNSEATFLYAYVVDELKIEDGKVFMRLEGDKRWYQLGKGEEAKGFIIKNVETIKREVEQGLGGYKSAVRQYWKFNQPFNQLREGLDKAIIGATEVAKYEVPSTAYLDMAVYGGINGRIKVDRKSGKTIYLDENNQLRDDKDLDKLREDFPTLSDFITEYEKSTGKRVLAAIPNGNLLANEWFVGFKEGKIYHRLDEPIEGRKYTFLIVDKQGKASIKECEVGVLKEGRDNILFATSGQPLVRDGQAVQLADIVIQFEDLRHLFTFPRIKWADIENLGFEISGQLSRSLYFGANYMVGKEDLLRRAANGEVIGLPIKKVFLDILEKHDKDAYQKFTDECYEKLKRELEEGLRKTGYVNAESKDRRKLAWGEYKIEGDTLYIRLKEGMYPHTAIGIKGNGQVVLYAVNGKSGRLGLTFSEMQKLMLEDGIQDAILIANGGDVVLRVFREGRFEDVISSPQRRKKFTSAIFVVVSGD